ncbi:zinc finger MYM-type protein 4 isoform X2 [Hoplias malabaricus]|uniref:zinc finger MYM-type protein 4 isoform X2 n=1 Tax=Hoplias malabaricus TaxID=27720 RepID=UPI003461BFBC
MSDTSQNAEEESTVMKSTSQVGEDTAEQSGDPVGCTDDNTLKLVKPENPNTSQSAEDELSSQEDLKDGTQELMSQQDIDKQEEEKPENEEIKQQAVDTRQEVEVQSQHEENVKEQPGSKDKQLNENLKEKSNVGQEEELETPSEAIRHQKEVADGDLKRMKAEKHQGEPNEEDEIPKEKNMDEEVEHGHQEEEANLKKDEADLKEEKVRQYQKESEHSETETEKMDKKDHKHGQEEDMEGQDISIETDRSLGAQDHEETRMDVQPEENTVEAVKLKMKQTEEEAPEENEMKQRKDKHCETENTESESLEECEEGMRSEDVGQEDENWMVIRTIDEDSDETSMDIDRKEESMQGDSEPCVNTDSQMIQDLKDEMMESSIQTPVHPLQPEEETENMDLDTSSVLSVKVKDEPMDEEYDQALVPQGPTGKVKDEPEINQGMKTEDEFKISAVFSVGKNSTPQGSSTGSATVNTSAKAPSNTSTPAVASASTLCVVCSGCKKVLLKGQTAFQRKGSAQLFCSPQCLCNTAAELVIKPSPKKICHCCLKGIPNPKDVILSPVDSAGTMKNFCSQKCLSTFNYKRDSANCSSKCSICQKLCPTRHEVNFLGSVHKLCSDACFNQFRSSNKLTMNCCVQCGGYCYSGDGQCFSLALEGNVKKFCSQNCTTTYKKNYGKPVPCTMCRGYFAIREMVESTNSEGNRELFCSSSCVTAYKVQTVSSSASVVECNNCKLVQVPQYHLAMSDGTIRNFCSFSCVVSFQDSFNKTNTQNQLNVGTSTLSTVTPQSVPKPASSKPISADPSSSGVLQIPAVTKIPCAQCQRAFFRKPELLDFKGKMYAFCDKACVDEFRRTNYIMAQCVYCKIDKVVKEIKRINNVDCSFCSEGCKLLYKHDLAKSWGKKHCRNCMYCNSTSQTLVPGLFSGKQEEFCGVECLSQYTLLFCQVAKCSTCKRAKKMVESVKWLGEMKHFCSLQCLMYFCSLHGYPTAAVQTTTNTAAPQPTATQPAVTQVPVSIAPVLQTTVPNTTTQTSLVTKEATPVIANVISLSNNTNGQPNVLGSTALQGTVPNSMKLIGNASTQTDDGKQSSSAPPRMLKNKALLCKPMSQNKGTSCKPNTCDMNVQTEKTMPEVVVLPLPVPVYVPVPMHLYSQYTPHAVGLPLPVPVPMFLPTTLNSAEQIVETIKKIKEKIPDNPLEADLIMMAEMVAEDSEKEKTVPHGSDQNQEDNFIEDFDLEALSSNLSWEEDSVSSASRFGRTSEPEKAPPHAPPSKSAVRSPSPTPASTPEEPHMDLEADYPVECFDLLEKRAQKEKTPTSKHKTRRRGRDCFPQKKRPRKRSGGSAVSPAGLPEVTKLHHEYGVKAWKSWVRWRNAQPTLETPKFGSRNMILKEDLLQCSTAELSYGLCKFINEVRRPNGEPYSPDSIHYLCLGIQQYLFENGRMENIFADLFYSKFSQSITNLLKDWNPVILPSGYVHSRVEEEYLWECKQLGAFSPSVLLNTLLYFCTKFFNFKTVAQHRRLSFAHVMRCTRSNNSGKVASLRFYPPVPKDSNSNADGVSAKRKRDDEDDERDEGVLEMQENPENPLRCPVRLYEFYLSKCSSSVKQRTNVFYLRPERCCVPNSPLWFSSMALDDEELETMLTRILTVRELYVERGKPAGASDSDVASDSD